MRHEIVFDRGARDWNEALPVGNGFLGAMVYGGDGREHLQMNEDSVWSGGPLQRENPDALRHMGRLRELAFSGDTAGARALADRAFCSLVPDMRHYEPLGDVWIDLSPMGECCTVRRVLDIDDALATVDRTAGGKRIRCTCFASNPDDVLVYRIEPQDGDGTDGSSRISCSITVSRTDIDNGLIWRCDGMTPVDDATVRLYGINGGKSGIGYEMVVRVIADGGQVRRIGATIDVTDATAVSVLVVGRTTYRADDPLAWCIGRLDAAAATPYRTLRERHIADYRRLYGRSGITFTADPDGESDGDTDAGAAGDVTAMTTGARLERVRRGATDIGLWETYLAFGRYLLIASSREGSLPANLQGLWNRDFQPAWGSKYTININLEMNYWFAERAGLGELHLPLIEHIRTMQGPGRRAARVMYGARGFVAHHNTDIWGDCAPQDTYPTACVWPLGAAWLCLHIVEHYDYTHDRAFMASCFDVLRDAVLFFTDVMVSDPDGYWTVCPSVSPENEFIDEHGRQGALCYGATMDNQILRALFRSYLRIADDLDCHDGLSRTVAERLVGLRPTTIGEDGRIMEWPVPREETEPGHRHFSPLFGLFPGDEIRVDTTPEAARAAAALLERRMEHGSGTTGWSKAWAMALHARLGDTERVWDDVTRLLADSTLDNLLDNHPPFQIDGNFGAVAAMYEMLAHDHGDTVTLLPALPAALPSGELHGMRLKGGAIMDLRWSHGRVATVTLTGLRDGVVRLTGPMGGTVDIPFTKGKTTTYERMHIW